MSFQRISPLSSTSQETIFSKRAKLFIHGETMLDKGTGNKTWRERGLGEISILRHRENQRLRLLMRQEKTLKIICNQAIDPRVELTPNVGSDRSWVWRAFDFSDGELVEESFAVRFADSEIANDFKTEYEKAQKEMQIFLEGADNPGEDGGAAGDEAAEALKGLSTNDTE